MGKVMFSNSISLDGFVAGPNDRPDNPLGDDGAKLFDWYRLGEVELALPGTDMTFKVSKASAELHKGVWATVGAMVAGRRMFDIAGAWGGHPPGGENCFIMTHNPPQEWIRDGSPFTFVTDGIESAVRQARQAAGDDRNVGLSSASVLQQALKAGLVDEIQLDLVPVMLGGGVRLFDNLDGKFPVMEIAGVVVGEGVTHLQYRVVK